MIEPIMFFGIGFFVASLLGLVLIPLVHNRAVRLTMKRLEAATPLSMAEIQADKDQLRAEFAMSTRRLELSVEQMKRVIRSRWPTSMPSTGTSAPMSASTTATRRRTAGNRRTASFHAGRSAARTW